jgi:hypothetical protein
MQSEVAASSSAPSSDGFVIDEIPVLLRGEVDPIARWVARPLASEVIRCVCIIAVGSGLFGAAMGYWRAPLQGAFAALKLPLVLVLTAFGNGLLNAMLAPLLGLNIGLRQALLAVLMSFTILAVILAGFSPVLFFLVWNTPPLDLGKTTALASHSLLLLGLVTVIAFAGITAHVRLWQLLYRLSGSTGVARKVLGAWLAGNLLLGSQISWILRPFIGSPGLPVAFFRPDAWRGSFFESVLHAVLRLVF